METTAGSATVDRPVGLVVLAAFQFIAAASGAIRLFTLDTALAGTISNLLLVPFGLITGYGLLKVNWRMGYVGGNVYAVVSIASGLVFGIMNHADGLVLDSGLGLPRIALSLPTILLLQAYPIALLLLLNLRYKSAFLAEAPHGENTEEISLAASPSTVKQSHQSHPIQHRVSLTTQNDSESINESMRLAREHLQKWRGIAKTLRDNNQVELTFELDVLPDNFDVAISALKSRYPSLRQD